MEVPHLWTENWKLKMGKLENLKTLLKNKRGKGEWNPTKCLIAKFNIVAISVESVNKENGTDVILIYFWCFGSKKGKGLSII